MIVLIMGVTGAGKTTVGTQLAEQLGWRFADADDFHSPENKKKMHLGIALTDADRAPWLKSIHDALMRWSAQGENAVVACSALKESYRKQLVDGLDIRIVFLEGSQQFIHDRLAHRTGHYATTELLASQFEALEPPTDAVSVSIDAPPEKIVDDIRSRLGLA